MRNKIFNFIKKVIKNIRLKIFIFKYKETIKDLYKTDWWGY